MELLTKDDIVQINELTIKAHGGNFVPPFNYLNENSLDYLLDAVDAEIFGEKMYQSLSDKAAYYMYSIVCGHIFQDGNKRTGLEAALLFLKLNGSGLIDDLVQKDMGNGRLIPQLGGNSNKILENFTLEMAAGHISLEEAKRWFQLNTK